MPILFSALWLGSPIWFAAMAGIAILLGLYEYYALTKSGGQLQGMIAAMAIIAAFYFHRHELIPAILAALVIVELISQVLANQHSDNFDHVLPTAAIRVFGVLYVALLGGYIVAIQVIESPTPKLPAKLLTLFFIVVFGGDTGAYYTGRTLGKHKLSPRISPGKTVEGLIGGIAGSMLAAVIAHFTFFPELQFGHALLLGFVMCLLGAVGDLCESMLKRGAKAKDAGKLIPGHGGLLDRLDSMLFNAPLLYYFYEVFKPFIK
ncbi:MAG: phosphatidate cytidylyltransferase [Blastocatellia bacterium]